MEVEETYFLVNEEVKNNCINFIKEQPTDKEKSLMVTIKPKTRSKEQNAKLHALLSDICKQCAILKVRGSVEAQIKKHGEISEFFFNLPVDEINNYEVLELTIDDAKHFFVSAHKKAIEEIEPTLARIEGVTMNLFERTSKMSIKRMISLIESITAWASLKELKLNDTSKSYSKNGY